MDDDVQFVDLSDAACMHQAERCRALIAEGADVNARTRVCAVQW